MPTVKHRPSTKKFKQSKSSWELFLEELNKKTPEPFKQPFIKPKKYTIRKKRTKEQLNRIRTTEKQNRNLLQDELNKNKKKNKYNRLNSPLGIKI